MTLLVAIFWLCPYVAGCFATVSVLKRQCLDGYEKGVHIYRRSRAQSQFRYFAGGSLPLFFFLKYEQSPVPEFGLSVNSRTCCGTRRVTKSVMCVTTIPIKVSWTLRVTGYRQARFWNARTPSYPQWIRRDEPQSNWRSLLRVWPIAFWIYILWCLQDSVMDSLDMIDDWLNVLCWQQYWLIDWGNRKVFPTVIDTLLWTYPQVNRNSARTQLPRRSWLEAGNHLSELTCHIVLGHFMMLVIHTVTTIINYQTTKMLSMFNLKWDKFL